MIALGTQFTGVFTNSDSLWSELDVAANAERDRVWRMPLDEEYMSQINGTAMDLCNTGEIPFFFFLFTRNLRLLDSFSICPSRANGTSLSLSVKVVVSAELVPLPSSLNVLSMV